MGVGAEVRKRRFPRRAAATESACAWIYPSLNVPRAASATVWMFEAIIHELGFLPANLDTLTVSEG